MLAIFLLYKRKRRIRHRRKYRFWVKEIFKRRRDRGEFNLYKDIRSKMTANHSDDVIGWHLLSFSRSARRLGCLLQSLNNFDRLLVFWLHDAMHWRVWLATSVVHSYWLSGCVHCVKNRIGSDRCVSCVSCMTCTCGFWFLACVNFLRLLRFLRTFYFGCVFFLTQDLACVACIWMETGLHARSRLSTFIGVVSATHLLTHTHN